MRKIVISLLLASVAASPAIAGPRDREDRTDAVSRPERSASRLAKIAASVRPARQPPRLPRLPAPREISRPQQSNDAAVQRRRQLDPAEAQAWRERRQQVVQSRQPDSADTLRQSDRPVPNVMRPRTRTPVVSDTSASGDSAGAAPRAPPHARSAVEHQLAQRPPLRLAAVARPATVRASTSASTTTRSAGAISLIRSVGGCGRAITAIAIGSTILGSTACPTRRRDTAGFAIGTTRCSSIPGPARSST